MGDRTRGNKRRGRRHPRRQTTTSSSPVDPGQAFGRSTSQSLLAATEGLGLTGRSIAPLRAPPASPPSFELASISDYPSEMTISLGYAAEVYAKAVYALGASEGLLQARLVDAYKDEGMHAYPPGGDISPDLRADIEALHIRLTNVQDQSEGSIKATVDAMDAVEREASANQLIYISYSLVRELHRGSGKQG